MINVLYLIDTMAYAGTQTHVANMIRGHDRSRFNPRLCCLQEKGVLGVRLEEEGVSVEAFGLRRIYGPAAARACLRYISSLRRDRIDVVHAYLFSAQAFGVLPARLAGVPLVIAGRRALGVYWTARKYRLARRLSNAFAHLQVGNSNAVREFIAREEGVPPGKIRIVYNGVDAKRFSPGSGPRGTGGVTVGYVGSLTRVKGVDVLLRATRRALDEFPGLRVRVVGEGPLAARRSYEGDTDASLRALAGGLGLGDRVEFAGASDRPEDEFRRMDIFVMPSISEGMSNAVLEAMATGLPVLASASGGNREVIADGETGALFPVGDDRALAKGILALARDAVRRRRMGEAGRRRVLERFTLERMVSGMEFVYLQGLGRGRGARGEEVSSDTQG